MIIMSMLNKSIISFNWYQRSIDIALSRRYTTTDTKFAPCQACKSTHIIMAVILVGSVEFGETSNNTDNKHIFGNISDDKKNDIFIDPIDDMTDNCI